MRREKPASVIVASPLFILYGAFTVLMILLEFARRGTGSIYIVSVLLSIAMIVAGYGLWNMLKWGMYLGVALGLALLVSGLYYLPGGAMDVFVGLMLLALIYDSRESFY